MALLLAVALSTTVELLRDDAGIAARKASARFAASSDEEAPSHSAPSYATSSVAVRLTDLERTRAQLALLWKAEQVLVRACMAKRGFDYVPPAYDAQDDENHAFTRVAPDDVDGARALGYGVADAIAKSKEPERSWSESAPSDPAARVEPSRRQAFVEALIGPPPPEAPAEDAAWDTLEMPGGARIHWYRDSCYADARRLVYGTDYAHNELGPARSLLHHELIAKAHGEPDFQQALAEWRGCMKERGFDYPHPGAAADALSEAYHRGKLDLAGLRRREIEVAVADADCHREGDLARVEAASRARAEQQLAVTHHAQLSGMAASQREAIERARSVLGESGEALPHEAPP